MNKFIFTLLFFSLCMSSNAQAVNSIIGKWQNSEDKDFQVEIYLAKDKSFYGKVINDIKTPSNNGKIILNKLIYNSGKKVYTGTMAPIDTKLVLNAEILVVNADKLKITVRKLFITKTMYLSRIV